MVPSSRLQVDSIHWLDTPYEVSVVSSLPQLEICNDNGCLGLDNTINMLGGQKVQYYASTWA